MTDYIDVSIEQNDEFGAGSAECPICGTMNYIADEVSTCGHYRQIDGNKIRFSTEFDAEFER
jgi:predicted nucleic-acid-binding Zn-ribbon protein